VKYFVVVSGEEVVVVLTADGAQIDGETVSTHLTEVDGTPLVILKLGDAIHRLAVQRGHARGEFTICTDDERFDVEAVDERARSIRDMARAREVKAGPRSLVAPMPGLILHVHVRPGDVVQAGQGLVVMEAMKMENELRAVSGGTVRAVLVAAGAAVEKGALLVELE
jgi:pyruvate carboxylase subunit B